MRLNREYERSLNPHGHRVYTVQTCRPVPTAPREVEPMGERTYRDPRTGDEFTVWKSGADELLPPRASRSVSGGSRLALGHRHAPGS